MSGASKKWLIVVGIVLAISGPFQCYLTFTAGASSLSEPEGAAKLFGSIGWNAAKALLGFLGGIGILARVRPALYMGIVFVSMVVVEFCVGFADSFAGASAPQLPWFHRLIVFFIWALMLVFLTRKSVLAYFRTPKAEKTS